MTSTTTDVDDTLEATEMGSDHHNLFTVLLDHLPLTVASIYKRDQERRNVTLNQSFAVSFVLVLQ
jgi:hypothetical protein